VEPDAVRGQAVPSRLRLPGAHARRTATLLDVLVSLDERTFPGCHVWVRPIGVFRMVDEAGGDDKVLCVPAKGPRYERYRDLQDI